MGSAMVACITWEAGQMLYRTRRDTRRMNLRRRTRVATIARKLAYLHTYAVEG